MQSVYLWSALIVVIAGVAYRFLREGTNGVALADLLIGSVAVVLILFGTKTFAATPEERALAERYNLPQEVVKLQKEIADNSTSTMAVSVAEAMAKECAAGIKTSCLQPPDESLIPPALQVVLIKALVMALCTALLVGIVSYFRRPKQ